MSSKPVLLFDGVCNLCNASVRWIIKRDVREQFRFASLQSDATRRATADADPTAAFDSLPDSIVLIDQDGIHTHSTAALRVARRLGFPYSLAVVGTILPRPLRDAMYRLIARNRYRWFGRQDSCMVPAPDLADRFLDAEKSPPTSPSR